jgi:hypothetical protein
MEGKTLALFKVLFRQLSGGTEEIPPKLSQDSRFPGLDLNLPNTKQNYQPLGLYVR